MTTEKDIIEFLRDPFKLKWTIQGFGMLRAYLADDEVERLHIWDAGMAVQEVSTVHDHPWDLDSRIVFGTLMNHRFVRSESGDLWNGVTIRTGEGGHPILDPVKERLKACAIEIYGPDDTYHQDAPEIHESVPTPGTVTLVRRTFSRQRDVAMSFWKNGEWVSAEPRPATVDEVVHFINLARGRAEEKYGRMHWL